MIIIRKASKENWERSWQLACFKEEGMAMGRWINEWRVYVLREKDKQDHKRK